MRRRAKPTNGKAEAKRSLSVKSPKNEGSRVRDLEKRLAESLERENATGELLKEKNLALTEALEQQTATAEILRVISSSPTNVQPVFDAIALSASRLCGGMHAIVTRFDGELIHLVAQHNPRPGAGAPTARLYPRRPSRDASLPRAILQRAVVHISDAEKDLDFSPEIARGVGARSFLAVPMLHEGRPIGAIGVSRSEAGPFPPDQIDLLKVFADQAVIAIENVRRFKETKESLEQQTATSEILRVISQSPTDVQPVFEAIVRSAMRLCDAPYSAVYLLKGELVHLVAHNHQTHHTPAELAEYSRAWPMPLTSESHILDAIRNRTVVHSDLEAHPTVLPRNLARARALNIRTLLVVPMLREGQHAGAIRVSRPDPTPFPLRQIALLQTFADQAVIAIENVRLFTELQERNRAITEAHALVTGALNQQTATSEILRVISSSPTDVQPVFDAISSRVVRLCDAFFSTVWRYDGTLIHHAADNYPTGEMRAILTKGYPAPPQRGSVVAEAISESRIIHVEDLLADSTPAASRGVAIALGYRTLLCVPMLRDDVSIGAIAVARREQRPFSDREIDLVKTFADQAVIAIENVRLFKELQEKNAALTQAHAQVTDALDQQTATSQILRVISRSPTDVRPVFDTIARNARRLCAADSCSVFTYGDDLIRLESIDNATVEGADAIRRAYPLPPSRGHATGRAILTARPVHIPDVRHDPEYELHGILGAGLRSIVAVPMLHDGIAIGTITLHTWATPRPFSDAQIALLQTFADQAVIAIENVRLFKELQARNLEIEQKSRELETASQHKSEFLANMSHELRTPLNAIIGFSEVLTERMFGELNEKQEEYLKDIYASGTHLLSLINDILDLSKIEAGRMELELSDFDLPTALDNALTLVRERAGRRSITLQTTVDERLGEVRADERKIRQVVLNLLSNALKFTPEGGRIEVRAVSVDGSVEVSVADTGVGIAPEDLEAVFEEFRQVGTSTAKQEGTGLGLALCRRFVELHGGRIGVTSQVGVGSTFTFSIPFRPGG